jgi:hypothetical protein
MNSPDTWFGLAALLALALIGAGSVIIHRKLRTRASLVLVCSLALMVAWLVVLSPAVEYWIIGSAAIQEDKSLLNIAYIADSVVVPALLLLVSATSFFIMARSLKPAV